MVDPVHGVQFKGCVSEGSIGVHYPKRPLHQVFLLLSYEIQLSVCVPSPI